MIPSRLSRKLGPSVRRHALSKCVLLPYESPLFGLFIRELRFCVHHGWNVSAPSQKCERSLRPARCHMLRSSVRIPFGGKAGERIPTMEPAQFQHFGVRECDRILFKFNRNATIRQ